MQWIDDDLYKKILDVMPICCVDACIVHDHKVLLVKRKDPPEKGSWWLPGGRLYKFENPVTCARRKAIEEVGIDCYVQKVLNVESTDFPDGPFGCSVHSVNFCYLLTPKEPPEVKLDSHCIEYRWVGRIEEGFHPYVKICMRIAACQNVADSMMGV